MLMVMLDKNDEKETVMLMMMFNLQQKCCMLNSQQLHFHGQVIRAHLTPTGTTRFQLKGDVLLWKR